MKKIVFFASALSILITQTGCFGSFELVKKVYEVNDGVSDNKFVKSLVFWIGGFIYGIAGFLDAVIFNLIEFWTGSNPIAMVEGEVEEQFMTIKGESYKVVASKNQFSFYHIQDGESIDMGTVMFDHSKQAWSFEKDGLSKELIKIEGETVSYSTINGSEKADISVLDCITLNENWNSTNLALVAK